MFPQLDRYEQLEPMFYASILCAQVELSLNQGRKAGDHSLQSRLDAAADAFMDGCVLQEMEDEEFDDD